MINSKHGSEAIFLLYYSILENHIPIKNKDIVQPLYDANMMHDKNERNII